MVKTASTMLPLGTVAPDFSLPNVDGSPVALADFADRNALLVMFICNHCPFVVHLRSALADFGKEYQEKGLGIVAVSANDVESHPDRAMAYVFGAEWTAMGEVGHWGHIHMRQNRYRADVTAEPVDGAWRITSLELLEEERIDPYARAAGGAP